MYAEIKQRWPRFAIASRAKSTKPVLRIALNRYREDGDREALRRTFLHYCESARPATFAQIARRAVMSINPFPANRYSSSLHCRRTGARAIGAYWTTVGEYLSYALISHTLEQPGGDAQKTQEERTEG